jgi:hypothetical protein
MSKREFVDLVDRFNASHGIGTAVDVRLDNGSVHQGETKSPAWMLGDHTPVVMVTGIRGAYALERVTPAERQLAGMQ